MVGNVLAGDFLAGHFLTHHGTSGDFMVGNLLVIDILTRIHELHPKYHQLLLTP